MPEIAHCSPSTCTGISGHSSLSIRSAVALLSFLSFWLCCLACRRDSRLRDPSNCCQDRGLKVATRRSAIIQSTDCGCEGMGEEWSGSPEGEKGAAGLALGKSKSFVLLCGIWVETLLTQLRVEIETP